MKIFSNRALNRPPADAVAWTAMEAFKSPRCCRMPLHRNCEMHYHVPSCVKYKYAFSTLRLTDSWAAWSNIEFASSDKGTHRLYPDMMMTKDTLAKPYGPPAPTSAACPKGYSMVYSRQVVHQWLRFEEEDIRLVSQKLSVCH